MKCICWCICSYSDFDLPPHEALWSSCQMSEIEIAQNTRQKGCIRNVWKTALVVQYTLDNCHIMATSSQISLSECSQNFVFSQIVFFRIFVYFPLFYIWDKIAQECQLEKDCFSFPSNGDSSARSLKGLNGSKENVGIWEKTLEFIWGFFLNLQENWNEWNLCHLAIIKGLIKVSSQ